MPIVYSVSSFFIDWLLDWWLVDHLCQYTQFFLLLFWFIDLLIDWWVMSDEWWVMGDEWWVIFRLNENQAVWDLFGSSHQATTFQDDQLTTTPSNLCVTNGPSKENVCAGWSLAVPLHSSGKEASWLHGSVAKTISAPQPPHCVLE